MVNETIDSKQEGKQSERTHIFAERLELVLGEMLTLLDL